MIPRPIATNGPHLRAAQSAPPAANQTPDSSPAFAQLMAANGLTAMNFVALHQGDANGNTNPDDRPHSKNRESDPTATAAAAAATPPTQPIADATAAASQAAQNSATTLSQAAQQAAQAASASQATADATPSAATATTLAAANAAAQANSNGPGGQTSPLPPGAAELDARIVAGTPNFLSQTSTVLGGLWHHAGDIGAGKNAANTDTGSAATGAADSDNSDAPNQTGASGKNAGTPAGPLAAGAHLSLDAAAATATAQDNATLVQAQSTAGNGDPNAQPAPALATSPLTAINAPVNPNPVVASAMAFTPVADQVAFSLKQAVQNGTNRIEIQLKPASLGAIDVKLTLGHDGKVTAVISADRSDTLNMLKQDQSGLQQALRDAGLQPDANSLNFNLRGDQQSQSQAQNYGPAANDGSNTESATAATSLDLSPRLRRHDGALDIQV
jgi:flagellar hook-length control protein FliK